jgi:hypothetical protein
MPLYFIFFLHQLKSADSDILYLLAINFLVEPFSNKASISGLYLSILLVPLPKGRPCKFRANHTTHSGESLPVATGKPYHSFS